MIDNDDPTNAAPIFQRLQRPLRTGLALIALSALVGLVAFSARRYFPTKSVRVSVVKYRGQIAPDFSLKNVLRRAVQALEPSKQGCVADLLWEYVRAVQGGDSVARRFPEPIQG